MSSRKEGIRVKGKITISEYRKEGLVPVYEKDNLVVNIGLSHICDRLKNNLATPMGYIGIGTGSTAVTAADTALDVELFRRIAANITAGVGTFEMDMDVSEFEYNTTWHEVAMFNAAVAGDMFNRTVIDYTKSGISVNVKVTITFTNI
jgi:hypothetical protein